MIKIKRGDQIPEGAVKKVNKGDITEIYFADEILSSDKFISDEKHKLIEKLSGWYKKQERKLAIGKNEYRDLQAAMLVKRGHRGMNAAQVTTKFTKAVTDRQALIDQRDTIEQQISDCTTIEELNSISW